MWPLRTSSCPTNSRWTLPSERQRFRWATWAGWCGPVASRADLLTCLSDLESLQIRDYFGVALDRVVGLDNVILNAGPRDE